MKSFIIRAETGLHARPATLFINKSKEFSSEIKVIKNKKEVDGKKFLQLLSLGVLKDDLIYLKINGNDEKEAMNALEKLIVNNFAV
ncbi:HPr family phosphocarrier protein [Vallitalea sp.]|uniref:HPr family phosphocarrier protein n=1 Tax=Vallitalea sp. TaxID=1882829 RepID=UPI0025DE4DC4|nr:HPr family phosphocarrier protein [Vallitalea sp.]MCT4687985.1 HPr family phosphocarrier protein [Vallitalea sp.]